MFSLSTKSHLPNLPDFGLGESSFNWEGEDFRRHFIKELSPKKKTNERHGDQILFKTALCQIWSLSGNKN